MPTITVENSLQLPRPPGSGTGHRASRQLTAPTVDRAVTLVRESCSGGIVLPRADAETRLRTTSRGDVIRLHMQTGRRSWRKSLGRTLTLIVTSRDAR